MKGSQKHLKSELAALPADTYVKPTHIPQGKWQEIASRKANGESLRSLVVAYGVSYEAVRQVLKKSIEM